MEELPIEAGVDEFVDLIHKQTRDRIECPACGDATWQTFPDTPVALAGYRIRLDVPADTEVNTGFRVVAFACRQCGFLRFHQVT
jgi:predicted RNA-binding Zn-ribbon protein involved in translation (DUF1610 family)